MPFNQDIVFLSISFRHIYLYAQGYLWRSKFFYNAGVVTHDRITAEFTIATMPF
jgi:hypothetical protein